MKRKESRSPTVIRGNFLSSNKIVLNVLFMLDNYPLKKKKKTHTHTHSYNHTKHIIMFFTFKNMLVGMWYQTHHFFYHFLK